MREFRISLPELALVAGTRAALGAGLAFLVADRLPKDRRMAVGWTLVTLGVLSSIPLAFEVFGRDQLERYGLLSDDDRNAASSNIEEEGRRTRKRFVW
jgi:hypothetical protein